MPKKIVILGAGISGLTAAWYLKKKHGEEANVSLIEKTQRAGGWIQTIHKDGFLFELGPRSCRSSGHGIATLELVEDLNLQSEVILADPSAQVRYLYTRKKLRRIPWGLPFLTGSLFRGVWKDIHQSPGVEDETIRDFMVRRLNANCADYLIDPLTSGIYAGDISKLSIRSCFPAMVTLEQDYGSLIKGLIFRKEDPSVKRRSAFVSQVSQSPLFSFRKGMGTLIDTLVEHLKDSIHYGCEVVNIVRQIEGFRLECLDGKNIEADQVISTLPEASLCYTSVVVVNLGYHRSILRKKGFGYLIPSIEKESILGCVWDSTVFPEQNGSSQTRLTVMLGGMHRPEVVDYSDEQITTLVIEALDKHMGIRDYPDVVFISRARLSIPQYFVGHQAWKSQKQANLAEGFQWIGTALNGVSVNDCIYHAKNLNFN